MDGSRLERLRTRVDAVLLAMDDAVERRCAYVHLYGVAAEAAALALRRGLDPDLAAAAGMLHDLYGYRTGLWPLHAENSAEDGRVLLREAGGYSLDDRLIVGDAVWHHTDKAARHGPYAELLKDADVWQHYLYNVTAPVRPGHALRLRALLAEQGLSVALAVASANPALPQADAAARGAQEAEWRAHLADLAEALAARPLIGDAHQAGPDLAPILRHFPRPDPAQGFDWCAAFVYHCCYQAGFALPIRLAPPGPAERPDLVGIGLEPTAETGRLAGVAAWVAGARRGEVGAYHPLAEPGFRPQRGDVVVYSGLLAQGVNEVASEWGERAADYDHLGVVLGVEENVLRTAEGNVGNRSGLFLRPLSDHVAGFIRLGVGGAA